MKIFLLEYDNGWDWDDHQRVLVKVFETNVEAKQDALRRLTGKSWRDMTDSERREFYIITPCIAGKPIDWSKGWCIDSLGNVTSKESKGL